jgi:hypothetical protein
MSFLSGTTHCKLFNSLPTDLRSAWSICCFDGRL